MKICLFGATGLLGSEFKRVFEDQGLSFVAPTSNDVSLLKHDKVLEFLKKESPSLIVNCAGYTAVDKAEQNQDICMALNAEAVETLVESGIPLINFSTEYVFNAPAGLEIPENYDRGPQSVYAQSKAKAEEALEASKSNWWNIRTSWLHGPGGNNFVATIKRLSQKYDELKIVDDQIGRPTYTPELAEFVTEHFINQVQPSGHYHLQNQGEPVSWAGFAEHFLAKENWSGTVDKIATSEYLTAAVRPKNSVLKNTKLEAQMRDWKETI